MLIQVAEYQWIPVSEIRRVFYHKEIRNGKEWWTTVIQEVDGFRHERAFDNKEGAHEYCVNMVAQINMEEGK